MAPGAPATPRWARAPRARGHAAGRRAVTLRGVHGPPQGPHPLGRQGHAPAPDHPHERQAARAGRQQARALLRHRGDGRRRDRARSGSSSRPRPATRSARPPATARSSACAITYIVQDEPAGPGPRGADRRAVPRRRPVRHVPRRQPAAGRHRRPRRGLRAQRARRADPAHAGARPRALRRRRARRRPRRRASPRSRPSRRPNLALVGVYMFTPAIHDAARAIEPVAARRARDHRRDPAPRRHRPARRAAHRAAAGGRTPAAWRTCSRPTGSILDTLEHAHRRRARSTRRSTAASSSRRARGWSAATVRGPAIIGAGARLADCYIGPYTAIGEDCAIERAEVEHSILLAGSSVIEPRRPHGVLAAGPQRHDRRAATASRAPTASWSATTPRSGSSDEARS